MSSNIYHLNPPRYRIYKERPGPASVHYIIPQNIEFENIRPEFNRWDRRYDDRLTKKDFLASVRYLRWLGKLTESADPDLQRAALDEAMDFRTKLPEADAEDAFLLVFIRYEFSERYPHQNP
jgi:hypothetical protein